MTVSLMAEMDGIMSRRRSRNRVNRVNVTSNVTSKCSNSIRKRMATMLENMGFEPGLIERAIIRFEADQKEINRKYDIATITDIVLRLQHEDKTKDDKMWTEWGTMEILDYLALDERRFGLFQEYAMSHKLRGFELSELNALTLRVMGVKDKEDQFNFQASFLFNMSTLVLRQVLFLYILYPIFTIFRCVTFVF